MPLGAENLSNWLACLAPPVTVAKDNWWYPFKVQGSVPATANGALPLALIFLTICSNSAQVLGALIPNLLNSVAL